MMSMHFNAPAVIKDHFRKKWSIDMRSRLDIYLLRSL